METQPRFKECDQVWFLSPRDAIRRGWWDTIVASEKVSTQALLR